MKLKDITPETSFWKVAWYCFYNTIVGGLFLSFPVVAGYAIHYGLSCVLPFYVSATVGAIIAISGYIIMYKVSEQAKEKE